MSGFRDLEMTESQKRDLARFKKAGAFCSLFGPSEVIWVESVEDLRPMSYADLLEPQFRELVKGKDG